VNDIPAGGFICIYAGQLLNDEGANQVSRMLLPADLPVASLTIATFATHLQAYLIGHLVDRM